MVLKKTLTLVQTLASLDLHDSMVYRRGFDNRQQDKVVADYLYYCAVRGCGVILLLVVLLLQSGLEAV